jgi:hypothetical protein
MSVFPWFVVFVGSLALWAPPAFSSERSAENSGEPLMLSEGAKAMVCEKLGFLALVRNSDGSIASPQFPNISVQHSDGLFALTEDAVDVRGMSVSYTSFLEFQGDESWLFSGFDGTNPFRDSCLDITGELAFSFAKIALAASWGMPHIEERVQLFDALQDDLQTRLEFANIEREQLIAENVGLGEQVAQLESSIDELLIAVCEITGNVESFATEVAVKTTVAPLQAELSTLQETASSLGGCLTNTVLTQAQTLEAR